MFCDVRIVPYLCEKEIEGAQSAGKQVESPVKGSPNNEPSGQDAKQLLFKQKVLGKRERSFPKTFSVNDLCKPDGKIRQECF